MVRCQGCRYLGILLQGAQTVLLQGMMNIEDLSWRAFSLKSAIFPNQRKPKQFLCGLVVRVRELELHRSFMSRLGFESLGTQSFFLIKFQFLYNQWQILIRYDGDGAFVLQDLPAEVLLNSRSNILNNSLTYGCYFSVPIIFRKCCFFRNWCNGSGTYLEFFF